MVERSAEVEELYQHAETTREFRSLAHDAANGILRELSQLTGWLGQRRDSETGGQVCGCADESFFHKEDKHTQDGPISIQRR